MNGQTQLRIIENGEDRQITLNVNGNIAQPTLDPTGQYAVFYALDDNAIYRTNLSTNTTLALIREETLNSCQLSIHADYLSLTYDPQGQFFLVTLANELNQIGIYKYNTRQGEFICEPLVNNAASPTLSHNGESFIYIDLEEGRDRRDLAIYHIVQNISAGFNLADNLNMTECYNPAYHMGRDAIENYTFIFTCINDDGITFYQRDVNDSRTSQGILDLHLNEFSTPLTHADVNNTLPGPAPDYLAFDDGQNIYFVVLWDDEDEDENENNQEHGVLISLGDNINVHSLSWVPQILSPHQ